MFFGCIETFEETLLIATTIIYAIGPQTFLCGRSLTIFFGFGNVFLMTDMVLLILADLNFEQFKIYTKLQSLV